MIEHILGHVRFKKPDATISVDFQPKEGITAVVGPNGVGKTFTAAESLRYLLFGSKALRSKLDTYAELSLTGVVAVHGQRYGIARSLKAAVLFLFESGDKLAVGQDEVTKKVTELLGYGLEVFDLCNASVQGETQALGALTPGKRKEKIDEVLRVSDVRAVEKALRDEAAVLRREAEALTRVLPQLGEVPVKPQGYQHSEEISEQIRVARNICNQRDALVSQIIQVAVPDEPTAPRVTQQQIHEAEAREELERLADGALPNEPLSEEEIIDGEKRWLWEEQRDARGPAPDMPIDSVRDELAILDEIVAIDKMIDIEVSCPKCDHEFRTRPVAPDAPAHTRGDLNTQLQRHMKHSEPLPPEPPITYSFSPSDAQMMRRQREAWLVAEDARKALKVLPSAKFMVSEARQTLANWNAYDMAIEKKRVRDVDNAMIERSLADLPVIPDLDQLNEAKAEAVYYEQLLAQFDREEARFENLQAQIADLQERAEDFLKGNKELSEARIELKSFLAPALSREATELLHDMTNGKLQSLIIDEDMDITVDGQLLETLSGAGKTVANIALRLALMRVLVGSAFPVFIGDEMDGDLDAERREATAQAMLSLKGRLKQIILITHKDVDIADHVIDLGDKA